MERTTKIGLTIGILFTILFLAWGVVRIVKSVQFDYGCEAYLKRAADANSVEMAKENLKVAIDYAEENQLTEGVVKIVFNNPKQDLGFWYQNLKACYEELDILPQDSTALEKTNVLMKLRESLVDSGESTSVTVPMGISIHPYNVIYCIWAWLSAILACVGWFLCSLEYMGYYW